MLRRVVPAGQATNNAARTVALKMAEVLGQPIFVDSKTDETRIISSGLVKGASAKGYTLLMGSSNPLVINPSLF